MALQPHSLGLLEHATIRWFLWSTRQQSEGKPAAMTLTKTISQVIQITILFLAMLLSSLSYAAPSLIPAPPSLAAKSYILIDATSGKVLVEHNADQVLPPASLTKIMTSYVAAHEVTKGNISLTDQVRISVKAWRKGGSKMYIKEGDFIALEDLLRGVIIQSGNDASIAVAEHVAGSEEAFADLMNQHAVALGMNNSHFVNATGWPAKNHHTNARDLSTLTQALIQSFPTHYDMYSEKHYTFSKIKQRNRNLLLWRDSTVDGVKTGHTEEAGYCLVASAEKNGMRLISVVMGTKSKEARATESQKLLTYGFRFYETHQAITAGDELNVTTLWMGAQDTLKLGVGSDVVITVPRGKTEALKAELDIDSEIRAPILKGDTYGQLTLKLNDEVVAEQPLIALEDIEKGGLFKQLWHFLYLFIIGLF